jgi:HME family heavy-metal exporter
MFAFLVRGSLRFRAFVLVVAGIMLAYGAITAARLPVDVLPDLNQGIVTVMTEAPGLSAEEAEQLVTIPIETALNGVAGVDRIRSQSINGLSIVFADFNLDTDIYRARQFVAERLEAVQSVLPPGTQPIMMPLSSLMGEILLVSLSGAPNADPMMLRDLATWVVSVRLRAIPGVSLVNPIGGLVRQFRVTLDPLAMSRLTVSIADVEQALQRFGTNSSGGFIDRNGQQFQIRTIVQPLSLGPDNTGGLQQLGDVVVALRDGLPVQLRQVADVTFAPMPRVGDAGYMGHPAVILSVIKQPGADTIKLTNAVETALADLHRTLPPGLNNLNVLFRQADFIEISISNVEHALIEAVLVVAVILLLFLGNIRTTIISLTAIPLSMLITFVVFNWMGLTINTMTLGGLAIAIGELVDDAVVDVENILRRLRGNRLLHRPRPAIAVIADASQEVRSGIVYSTVIIILVFVPLFAIPGIEGRMFAPLGVAYIVSILASLVTSITVTPVLCSLLLPNMRQLDHGDAWMVRGLKWVNLRLVRRALARPWMVVGGGAAAVAVAIAIVPSLPRTFLPGFNETSLVVSVAQQPGVSLAESARIGALAERLMLTVPEVTTVGRRTGRSETDEHALGVNENEIEVDLKPSSRTLPQVIDDIRSRLAGLPAVFAVEQPISHRLFDHILTGVSAQVVVKVFGEDFDHIRTIATDLESRLKTIPGLTDVMTERQVRVPQIRIRVDNRRAAMYGLSPGAVSAMVEHLAGGQVVSQVITGRRRVDVVLRLPESSRSTTGLADWLIQTPTGDVPLSYFSTIEEIGAPNEILREDGLRRIAVTANGTANVDRAATAEAIRTELARTRLPPGYSLSFEGTFAEQDAANLRLAGLGGVSLVLIFMVLYARYRSAALALIIMGNVPLALVGSVIALKLAGVELSLASMIGFVTLTGISARNGILKVSHTINLMVRENEVFGRALILRACQERMLPVLMTATSAGIALVPLLFDAHAPGKEILHPVAVVIFGGLISSTLLDAVMTPSLLYLFGRAPAERLVFGAQGGKPQDAY